MTLPDDLKKFRPSEDNEPEVSFAAAVFIIALLIVAILETA